MFLTLLFPLALFCLTNSIFTDLLFPYTLPQKSRTTFIANRTRFPIKAILRLSTLIAQYAARLSAAKPKSVERANNCVSLMDFCGSRLLSLKNSTNKRFNFLCLCRPTRTWIIFGLFSLTNCGNVISVRFNASLNSQKAQQTLTGKSKIEKAILRICNFINILSENFDHSVGEVADERINTH